MTVGNVHFFALKSLKKESLEVVFLPPLKKQSAAWKNTGSCTIFGGNWKTLVLGGFKFMEINSFFSRWFLLDDDFPYQK